MLDTLIKIFLSKRILGLVVAVFIIIAGIRAFQKLPIDAYPDISTTQVQIIVKAPGMTPLEVEKLITYPLEVAVRGMPKQTVLRSISKYSLSIVTVDFQEGTDIYWARQIVSERIGGVINSFPEGVNGGLAPITTPLSDAYMFLVKGKGYSPLELRDVMDWIIRPRLLTIDGVADVTVMGGQVKSFQIIPDPLKLKSLSLTVSDIINAVRNNNDNAGGDRIVKNDEFILVRTEGRLKTTEDIKNILIESRNGKPIFLHEIAQVKIGGLIRFGATTVDGKGEGIQAIVLIRRGVNGREVVAEVKKMMKNIRASLPGGISIKPFYDRSDLIEKAVGTVETSLGQAVILVLVVLFLFLGNFMSAFSTGIILPLAVLGAFILMYFLRISANLMSLGGLAISIGILVDSAVVVVENIHNFLRDSNGSVHKLNLVFRATKEVSLSVVSSVVIIIASLLPIFTLTGIEGKLFRPLAVTLALALVFAMFLALTVIPAVASLLMKKKGENQKSLLLRGLLKVYNPVLNTVMKHPGKTVAAGIIALAASLTLYPLIGKEFLPELNEGTMVFQTEHTPSVSLQRSIKDNLRLQKALMKLPEIAGIVGRTGADEQAIDPMGFYETDHFVIYAPKSEWKVKNIEELKDKIRKIAEDFPGMQISFTQPIDMRISEIISGVKAAVAIKIYGDSLDVLEKKSAEIERIVKSVDGAVDIRRTPLKGQEYLEIKMNKKTMGFNGIHVHDINSLIKSAIGGETVSYIYQGDRKYPVFVRFPEKFRKSKEDIAQLQLKTAKGGFLSLHDLTHIENINGPIKIERDDGKRRAVVQCNVKGRDVVGFVEELKRKISKNIVLPPGYYVTFGGQFENQQRATARIMITVPIAVILIYLLLFIIFRSGRQAFMIMGTIPLSFIGGLVSLYLSGFYLSISASLGFIALFGISIENSIVMINYFNQLIAKGMSVDDAVELGAKRRLRPVLMTAILTMLGLVPILFASGPGSEIQKPLAVVVFGGVLSSMLLTLIILPPLFSLVMGHKMKTQESDKPAEISH